MAMTTSDDPAAGAPEPRRPAELEAELARVSMGLRELDHRIKNDLQLMASVFLLQMRKAEPGPQRESVRTALARLGALSAVHRRLNPLATELDAAELVRDVAAEAAKDANREDVRVELALSPVAIATRQAAPLALIVGELVRNALSHAFPARGGTIFVSLEAAEGAAGLTVQDDGVGSPGGIASATGFGATLVGLLAQQLRGEFSIADVSPGVRAAVRFPLAA